MPQAAKASRALSSRVLVVLALALSLLTAAPAHAAQPPPPASASASPPVPAELVAPDSPRACMSRFAELARAGEFGDAAAYLDLSDAQRPDAAQLARRLKAVLDAQGWFRVEALSPKPWGEPSDKLPGVIEVGSIPGPSGKEPVRLVRRAFPDGARWLFSRNTVDRIDDWYGRLRDRWLREYLPERLLRSGPHELLWWQWIALPVVFLLSLGAGNVLGFLSRLALGRVVARTKAEWDDALLRRLGGPLTLLWAVVSVDLVLPRLSLYPPGEAFMERVIAAGFYVALFWCVERGIDIAAARALEKPQNQQNPAARSLIPLGARASKVALVAVAAIAALSALGYPVASLLAGLGIGGVAIALAAQKTVENLFGSLSIGVDQPFRVGDFITVDGLVTGTVESIGLRSTRIRTLDRTLVTIPNGKLADMRVESYAPRDRIRLLVTLPLDRRAGPATVRAILEGARAYLKQHPKAFQDRSVSLAKIGEGSLDVEVVAWFETTSWDEFLVLREEAILALLDVVEKAGTRLAYPTRTLHVERE
jgi:MscS family membrane protein